MIWGLCTLAQIENEQILLMCSRALCCLSEKFAKDFLTSVAATIVVKLINMDQDAEKMKLGAIILTNMLMVSTSDHESFRRVAVQNMQKLVLSKASHRNLCVHICCYQLNAVSPYHTNLCSILYTL